MKVITKVIVQKDGKQQICEDRFVTKKFITNYIFLIRSQGIPFPLADWQQSTNQSDNLSAVEW